MTTSLAGIYLREYAGSEFHEDNYIVFLEHLYGRGNDSRVAGGRNTVGFG